jgi:hypothetical protein
MLHIDKETNGLVCIQLPLNERRSLVERLRGLALSGGEISVPADNGIVRFILTDGAFMVDASGSGVSVQMRPDDCTELADAIVEHMSDDSGLPLDHSFEALGAILIPDDLEDAVLETMEG